MSPYKHESASEHHTCSLLLKFQVWYHPHHFFAQLTSLISLFFVPILHSSSSNTLLSLFFVPILHSSSSNTLLSLFFVPPTRLCPQQLVPDVMGAVRNKNHSVSMSSVQVGSSSHLDEMLSVNAVRSSLSANNSHLIRKVFRARKVFRFLKGFKVQTTRW